jgi:hypothetical protein
MINEIGWLDETNTTIHNWNEDEIADAMLKIPEIIESGRRYKVGSYHGKHVLERHCEKYISNGLFTVAMCRLGYKYKKYGINSTFQAKFKNLPRSILIG